MPTIIMGTQTVQHNNFDRLEVTDLAFEQRAADRWREGRDERGLAPEDPFQGNVIEEFVDEMLDGGNYLSVMYQQGRIDELTEHRARVLLHDLFTMAETASMPTVTSIHERSG